VDREDPKLITLIERFGSTWVSSKFSDLTIVEIPLHASYTIRPFDDREPEEIEY
jgi:hypothetical protein